jgi:hypothetical protein
VLKQLYLSFSQLGADKIALKDNSKNKNKNWCNLIVWKIEMMVYFGYDMLL